ncbi:MAG: DUF4129 domain-containing protein [Methanobacteriota archaeon]|nr:MAG: DUF4129 domain-containing protein [Euryarchaeota archaeon]
MCSDFAAESSRGRSLSSWSWPSSLSRRSPSIWRTWTLGASRSRKRRPPAGRRRGPESSFPIRSPPSSSRSCPRSSSSVACCSFSETGVARSARRKPSPGGRSSGAFTTVWPAASGWPVELFLIAAVLAALAWLVYLLRRSRRPDPEWETAFPIPIDRQAAVVAVRATIRDLEEGGDVRTAILACFERFCALLGSRGITDQDALTPHELERLAVDRLRVSRDASGILTSLFEEARYSEHPLGERDRARAIESLGQIQAALEA